MGRDMENLRIYRVSDKYIAFLRTRDSRVQFNKHHARPYIGVVLHVGEFKYFVPMESPKPGHEKMKPGVHILKMDKGRLGLLGFNNMIPVRDDVLISFNIDDEPNAEYASLLRKQVYFCNRNKTDILNKASRTYYDVVNEKNKFLKRISCDFKKLEKACKQFDANR